MWKLSTRLSKKNCYIIFLVEDPYGNKELTFIKTEVGKLPSVGIISFSYFYYRCSKYVWNTTNEAFEPLSSLIPQQTVDECLSNSDGLFYDDYIDL